MSILKKQGVAILVALVMIAAAVGIGWAKQNSGAVTPQPGPVSTPGATDSYYVYDDAGVFSGGTVDTLSDYNRQLMDDLDVVVAVVTCNYGREDLYNYALDYAEDIGLGQYDFIVVLDISGENYWLVQGAGLVDQFTDQNCSDYAWDYMERDFASGNYGGAALSLVEVLADWYYDNA